MAATFDVIVIGDDAPSLCAAAAAAQRGARTALAATGAVTFGGPSICDIPNSVWRRLELQAFGLETEPVSARITLFAKGKSATTYRDSGDTMDALRAIDSDAAALWPEMIDEIRALGESRFAPGPASQLPALATLDCPRAFADLGLLTGAGTELIEDYVNSGPLNTHINAHALAPFGLGGDEAGSAIVLPDFFDEHAWRVRAKPGARSIIGALRKACERHGVVATASGVGAAAAEGAKHNDITFNNGEKIRSQYIFFACPEAAEAAGFRGDDPCAAANRARAVMRIKLRGRIEPPAGDLAALFQIVDCTEELKKARGAALMGQISEALPVEFEFTDKGDIIARTSYIPMRFLEEGEWRDWTGQDRQLLASAIVNRLASRIEGLHEQIKKTDLKIVSRNSSGEDKFADATNVILQSRQHNAVAAAVALMDSVLDNG